MSEKASFAARDRLSVALDVSSLSDAMRLCEHLRGRVGWVKIGKQLFVAEGPEAVRRFKRAGFKVFLDLKFHDIPNTVAAAGIEAARLGVDLFNVHAVGGRKMMEETARRVREAALRSRLAIPKIIAVTVLTSLDQADLDELGLGGTPEVWVLRWAALAMASGLDGVVCSPHEVRLLRERLGPEPWLVTPGIRSPSDPMGDQRRTLPAGEAVAAGATLLVVGRPFTQVSDPAAVADALISDIAKYSMS